MAVRQGVRQRAAPLARAAAWLLAVLSAVAAASRPRSEDALFRVVTIDGRQQIGRLEFRATGFAVSDPPAEAAKRGGRARRKKTEPQPGPETEKIARALAPEAALGRIDRVESSKDGLVFQAPSPASLGGAMAGREGFAGGYGGLSFRIVAPDLWEMAEVGEDEAVAVRRARGEIVGSFRIGVARFGDGSSLELTWEREPEADPALLDPLDRARFWRIDEKSASWITLEGGRRVRRLAFAGVESGTGEPLHHVVYLFEKGPFLPRADVMARGPRAGAVLLEGRALLETVSFATDEPALARKESPGSGADVSALAQALASPDVTQAEELEDGRYVSERLGVRFREPPPRGFAYRRVGPEGFLVIGAVSLQRSLVLAGASLSLLRGKPRVGAPEGWISARFSCAAQRTLKPVRSRIGRAKAWKLAWEEEQGGSRLIQRVFLVPAKDGATIVVAAWSFGAGKEADEVLSRLTPWLRSFETGAR